MRNTPLIVMGVLLIVLGVAAFFSRELIDGKRDLVVRRTPPRRGRPRGLPSRSTVYFA